MSRCRVLSCVVAYEDAASLAEVLRRLSAQILEEGVEQAILVCDNSASPAGAAACQKVTQELGANYVKLENLGVSGAYAHAGEIARREDYDFLWLWDQDSRPSENVLLPLVRAFRAEPHARLGLVGPKLHDPTGVDQHWLFEAAPYDLGQMASRRFPMDWLKTGVAETTFIVNSGALLSVPMLREVGNPSVDYFMDLVDFEYSSRVVRAGYGLRVCADALVEHRVGDPTRFRFLWKTGWARNYNPLRYYYQAKNEILLAYDSGGTGRMLPRALGRLFVRPIKIAFDRERVGKKILVHFVGVVDGLLNRRGKSHRAWMS